MNNNKGFSLIELLVAIGVSGIVILMISFIMVQGTTLFKGENEVIDIQSESQIVRNQLTEALMGAKSVVVVNAGEDIVIYTGPVNNENNSLIAETAGDGGLSAVTTERIITYDDSKNSLYISSTSVNGATTSEGSLISDCVTDMVVVFNEDCAKRRSDGSIEYYKNPFSLDIKLKLEDGEQKSDLNISVRIRNILKEVAKYTTSGLTIPIKDATSKSIYKVK